MLKDKSRRFVVINLAQVIITITNGFLNFLECVEITSVRVKVNRPLLQHCLLLLEYNKYENSNVAAGLPEPIGHDCVFDSACNSSGPFHFE